MIIQYPTSVGSATIGGGVTTVDCEKQVRSWRLLRFILHLLIPTCNTTFPQETKYKLAKKLYHNSMYHRMTSTSTSTSVTGTIYGYRKGKAIFCIQTSPKSSTTSTILFLELAVSTTFLAKEMKAGHLRIALECNPCKNGSFLLCMPIWTMYCNGRKVGSAVGRRPTKADLEVLHAMEKVGVGAGIISGEKIKGEKDDDVLYLRGNFERGRGSLNSESFHLLDPDGNTGQELSFFFMRSIS